MKKRPFGSTGRSVSVIGQGTWDLERDDPKIATSALRAGLDAGMTHIDTAEMYGSGQVEELLGRTIMDRRSEIFLVSKVLPENASRSGAVRACERSLKRLRTDHLDCYLLHWEGPHPLEDTIAAFEELRAAGKILSFGVSNFDETRLAEAVAIAGEDRIACNQLLYHLGERTIEHAVVPYCEEHGIAVVGYSPFSQGLAEASSGPGRTLQAIAAARNATRFQIALAFLVRHPDFFAIPKSGRPAHVRENAAAHSIELTDAERSAIEAAFPLGPRREGVATA